MNFVSSSAQAQGYTEEQWNARVDLAAAHRCAVMHDLHEGIFNHLTLRVPGHTDRYYQIPFGTHWSEVTASCFMEVNYDGDVVAGEGIVERSAYCIHAPMHKTMDHANAVFHTHMPYASALTRLEDQKIQPIGQTELGTMMKTGYDMIFERANTTRSYSLKKTHEDEDDFFVVEEGFTEIIKRLEGALKKSPNVFFHMETRTENVEFNGEYYILHNQKRLDSKTFQQEKNKTKNLILSLIHI